MRANRIETLRLHGEDGAEFTAEWDNRGEPYREGTVLKTRLPGTEGSVRAFLEDREAIALRDWLIARYPLKGG